MEIFLVLAGCVAGVVATGGSQVARKSSDTTAAKRIATSQTELRNRFMGDSWYALAIYRIA